MEMVLHTIMAFTGAGGGSGISPDDHGERDD
jgi:hypothetical protein